MTRKGVPPKVQATPSMSSLSTNVQRRQSVFNPTQSSSRITGSIDETGVKSVLRYTPSPIPRLRPDFHCCYFSKPNTRSKQMALSVASPYNGFVWEHGYYAMLHDRVNGLARRVWCGDFGAANFAPEGQTNPSWDTRGRYRRGCYHTPCGRSRSGAVVRRIAL